MVYVPVSEDYDLDLLDGHLSSPELTDDAMLLSELDGYLTAIVIAPTPIQPNEWLPGIWGEGGPPFAGAQEAGQVIAAIMGLYNDNLSALADQARLFEPLFVIDRDGSTFADIWAQGFVRGVALRLEEWRTLFEDKKAFDAYAPIMALSTEPDELPEVSSKQRDKISRGAARSFPKHIAQIQAFWRRKGLGPTEAPPPRTGRSRKSIWIAEQQAAWAEQASARRSSKVRRNDPCLCGSGRKYKQCCGV